MSDILIVGSAGQLGFELMRAAWPRGCQIFGVDLAELDITDAAAVARELQRLQPALVVNAAAYTAVDRAEDEPELALRVNRDGVANLARAGMPLVHVSTDYVFDGEKAGQYLEQDATGPLGVYGQSKLEGEQALRSLLAEHVILRTAWVFGAHGQNFVKTMLRLGAERDVVRVVDDQRGTPTPAAAIAAAIAQIAAAILEQRASYGTYHFAGAPPVTWYGFARAIFDEQRARGERVPELVAITTAEYPTRAKRPRNAALDSSAIGAAFGVSPPDWRSGLCAVLDELGGRNEP
jgi:dTDP-4-dehydrorhamnose reductase